MTTTRLLVILGVITGVISAMTPDSVSHVLRPVSVLFLLGDAPIHPGLFFAPVIGLAVWWAGEKRIWVVGLMVLVTVFSWSAAVSTAYWVFENEDLKNLIHSNIEGTPVTGATSVIWLITGFLAGVVGAAIMVCGSAFVFPSFRGFVPIATTTIMGGLTGLLIYPFLAGWNETVSLVILFSVWQASVGACLGRWLTIDV